MDLQQNLSTLQPTVSSNTSWESNIPPQQVLIHSHFFLTFLVLVPPILRKQAEDRSNYFSPLKAVKNRSVLVLSQPQALTLVDHYKKLHKGTPKHESLSLLRDKIKNLLIDVPFEFEAAKKMVVVAGNYR
jgi:hypothetical protein